MNKINKFEKLDLKRMIEVCYLIKGLNKKTGKIEKEWKFHFIDTSNKKPATDRTDKTHQTDNPDWYEMWHFYTGTKENTEDSIQFWMHEEASINGEECSHHRTFYGIRCYLNMNDENWDPGDDEVPEEKVEELEGYLRGETFLTKKLNKKYINTEPANYRPKKKSKNGGCFTMLILLILPIILFSILK